MCGEYLLIGENGAWKMPSKGLTAESLPIENPKWRWNGVKFNSNVRTEEYACACGGAVHNILHKSSVKEDPSSPSTAGLVIWTTYCKP